MGNWIDLYNSRGGTTRGGTFTGTMQSPETYHAPTKLIPLANAYADTADTCGTADEDIAVPAFSFTSTSNELTEAAQPLNTVGETVEPPSPTVIMLRPVKTSVELLGCNDVSNDYGADKVDHNDSLYLDREATSWILDGYLPEEVGGYVGGVYEDKFYLYGGMVYDENREKVASGKFMSYDFKTKESEVIWDGNISPRYAPVGLIKDGQLYVHGGFNANQYPSSYKMEAFSIRLSTGIITNRISFPSDRVYAQIVEGYSDKLLMGHTAEPNALNYWDWDGSTWEKVGLAGDWIKEYDGSDYVPTEGNLSTQAFAFHKGHFYHFQDNLLLDIIYTQDRTTNGVALPNMGEDPLIATWGDYMLFYSRSSYSNDAEQYDVHWFNTVTRFFGTLDVIGQKPYPSTWFRPVVVDDWLYVIGGGWVADGAGIQQMYKEVWKLDLADFFGTVDTCGAIPVPPDTRREVVVKETEGQGTITACKEFPGHPCGSNGSYVRDYNDPN